MTVLFVLATLTLFLTLDHFVVRSRTRKAAQQVTERLVALGQAFQPIPDGVRLRVNHTWAKDDGHGIVTIGLDEFLAKFLGAVEAIVMPASGAEVNPATRGIALEDGEKSIRLVSPVTGKVVSVNHEVLRTPALAARDPYGQGWLMKVQTEKSGGGMIGAQAMQWLREQAEAAREFFSSREGQGAYAYAQDGGEPVAGLMKQFDAGAWREFQHRFLDAQSDAEERVSIRSHEE
jgi:glycine cleavage system H protein